MGGSPLVTQGHPGVVLGHLGIILGHPEAPWGHPGSPWGHPWVILGHPGVVLGHPGVILGHPEVTQGHLGSPRGRDVRYAFFCLNRYRYDILGVLFTIDIDIDNTAVLLIDTLAIFDFCRYLFDISKNVDISTSNIFIDNFSDTST